MKFALLALFSVLLTAQASTAKQNAVVEAFPGRVTLTVDLGLTQSTSGQTDVLFVVDNSGSMNTHQQNLIRNIPTLVDGLINSNLDFHAAVINTDNDNYSSPCCGQFNGTTKVISRSTPNAASELAKNLNVGTNGSGTEKIMDTISAALDPKKLAGVNAGFLRPNANLAIIFVSDAEDQSTVVNLADFTTFLKSLKSDPSMISIQGIMVPSADTTCMRDDEKVKPTLLETLLSTFNGQQYNLCTPNYPGQMKSLTDYIVGKSQKGNGAMPQPQVTRIPLPSVPDLQSVSVSWGSTVFALGDLSYGWVFDRAKNEIVLGDQIDWTAQSWNTPLVVNYIPQAWK